MLSAPKKPPRHYQPKIPEVKQIKCQPQYINYNHYETAVLEKIETYREASELAALQDRVAKFTKPETPVVDIEKGKIKEGFYNPNNKEERRYLLIKRIRNIL